MCKLFLIIADGKWFSLFCEVIFIIKIKPKIIKMKTPINTDDDMLSEILNEIQWIVKFISITAKKIGNLE